MSCFANPGRRFFPYAVTQFPSSDTRSSLRREMVTKLKLLRHFPRFMNYGRAAKLPILRLTECTGGPMTREERRQKLESFGCAPALLSAALRRFPKKMWLYKPTPERWSIHETILHLADSEASAYVRCRSLIAEPATTMQQIDAARWAGSLGYYHQSTREALEIIRRLRRMTYHLLFTLPEQVWLEQANHPDKVRMTLEDWVEHQERHIPHHIEQIKQNYEIWLARHPPRRPATPSARPSVSSRLFPLSAEL
jgi:DinB superfamily